jgi:hypothetical protein
VEGILGLKVAMGFFSSAGSAEKSRTGIIVKSGPDGKSRFPITASITLPLLL